MCLIFFTFGHFTDALFLCAMGELAPLERTVGDIIEDFLCHLNKELENSQRVKTPLGPPPLAYNKDHTSIHETHRYDASCFSGENSPVVKQMGNLGRM